MPRLMELDAEEMRVLGCLAEKQLTTPAAVSADPERPDPGLQPGDQPPPRRLLRRTDGRSGRHQGQDEGPGPLRPSLRTAGRLSATPTPSTEALGLDCRQLALLAVLMLRGPQTLAELRTRTQRMAEFADRGGRSRARGLARRDLPSCAGSDVRPGQKEERYIQLLGPQGTVAPSSPPDPTQ